MHYYAIYNLRDGVIDPWAGYSYRRDWVVKYAKPTEYVWDWDDADVQKNGHKNFFYKLVDYLKIVIMLKVLEMRAITHINITTRISFASISSIVYTMLSSAAPL